MCGPSKFPTPLMNAIGVFQIVKNVVNVFVLKKNALDLVNALLTFEISREPSERFWIF